MEINQLLEQGFSKATVARKLGISRSRVYRYLVKDCQEMAEWIGGCKTRRKKLDDHKSLIHSWLKEHPDMSGPQVFDWLSRSTQTLKWQKILYEVMCKILGKRTISLRRQNQGNTRQFLILQWDNRCKLISGKQRFLNHLVMVL